MSQMQYSLWISAQLQRRGLDALSDPPHDAHTDDFDSEIAASAASASGSRYSVIVSIDFRLI